MDKSSFSIRESSVKLGVSEMYLRKMINVGKIETVKVSISPKVWRHEVSSSELERFKTRSSNRSSREDGRNKFVIYLTPTELGKVQKSLKESGMGEIVKLLVRSNPSKSE
ncbi:MAG: hypothetical protein MUO31_11345 [Thermodesulfovibrionales bacterium]|nr:hypothetical protein [Thermodesulfovibrionales bacterium]